MMSYDLICANAVLPLVAVWKEDDCQPPERDATKTCDGRKQGIPSPTEWRYSKREK